MTRWTGKLLGVVAGALLVKPALIGALVGLLLGHAIDSRWLSSRRTPPPRDDAYGYFGLPDNASDADVDLAYRRLITRCHPDRFGAADAARRRQADAEASEINAAYERIKAMRRRR